VTASNVRGGDKAYRPENLLDGNRTTYWATDDAVTTADVVLEFPRPISCNAVRLRENIRLGQRVDAFVIEAWTEGAWQNFGQGTSIGLCRLIKRSAMVSTARLRVRITAAATCPAIEEVGVFADKA
jgi:alpha-L-fucosidase